MKAASNAASAVCLWCRSYLVCQRLRLWLQPKQRALEEKRDAARGQDEATEQTMARHSDIKPVAASARAGLSAEQLPEHQLLVTMEMGELAHVDGAILDLLRFGSAEEEQAREALLRFDDGHQLIAETYDAEAGCMVPCWEESPAARKVGRPAGPRRFEDGAQRWLDFGHHRALAVQR